LVEIRRNGISRAALRSGQAAKEEHVVADRIDVAVLVGSLRPKGYSSLLANALIGLAPDHLAPHVVGFGDLPLYIEDLEKDVPPAWAAFRDTMRAAQAVLFVTPEYNRSIPGGLKNAVDVGSRPYGQSIFSGKPAAVVSQSPGAVGGFGAHHDLRRSLVFLDMPVLQQPEMYIARSNELFDDKGAVKTDDTRKFLSGFMTSFGAWIDRFVAR
jgi:chromate reductase